MWSYHTYWSKASKIEDVNKKAGIIDCTKKCSFCDLSGLFENSFFYHFLINITKKRLYLAIKPLKKTHKIVFTFQLSVP